MQLSLLSANKTTAIHLFAFKVAISTYIITARDKKFTDIFVRNIE
jgi:hypothetical protein